MSDSGRRVLFVVVCAAPPALGIDEFVSLAQDDGWDVCLIPSPTAATWLDVNRLAEQSGHPVRFKHRGPDETPTLPAPDAIAVVPATFNTINKWAAGISDTHALGVLNEALGLRMPVVVAPYVKPALAAHPAFAENLEKLRVAGVDLIANEAIRPDTDGGKIKWSLVLEELERMD